jgi:hypothetical protein
MATSGTTDFDLDLTEVIEEAWERAGSEMRTGLDLRTARRSMNLMMIEWQNRGINMWTLDDGEIALVDGTATYTLPTDTIDLIEQVIRTNSGNAATQSDLSIPRISMPTYSSIPNKLIEGRPVQVLVNRLGAAPTITLWPIPSSSDYVFKYWRMRRIEDVGTGIETPDMTFRFYPALVAGLAYHIAMKMPNLIDRVGMLKEIYEEQFMLAAEEDREKATLRLVPRIGHI